jgi:hypothetical protein
MHRGKLVKRNAMGLSKGEVLSFKNQTGLLDIKGAKTPYGKIHVNEILKTLRIMLS